MHLFHFICVVLFENTGNNKHHDVYVINMVPWCLAVKRKQADYLCLVAPY